MQPNGVVLVLCKQIDNHGDIGFALRLCRALRKNHHVILLHHSPLALKLLGLDDELRILHPYAFDALDCTHKIHPTILNIRVKAIVEPFGTSSLHAPPFFDAALKTTFPNTPWLVIDYLCAEPWVENLHDLTMTEPSTGHKASFYCPGFSQNTAGIIHHDFVEVLNAQDESAQNTNRHQDGHCKYNTLGTVANFAHKIFIFAYPHAPLDECALMLKQMGCTIDVASAAHQTIGDAAYSQQPWVAQIEFDALLQKYDLLFVRGEDSFVRAQLAGKPFVWNIYPTPDHAHIQKLQAFFERYANGLSPECRNAIWSLWCYWNHIPLTEDIRIEDTLHEVTKYWEEWCKHATQWRNTLKRLPDLAFQVDQWIEQQTSF